MRQNYLDYYSNHIHHIDRNNNMGLVRYILAFGVLIAHFNILCGADVPWIISSHNRVGGFFALSGFVLIGGLLKGTNFKDFAIKRMWRIIPSYFFVVLSGAFLLVFLSEYDAISYFTSGDFWKYLAANLSFLNFLHPSLPGVFTAPTHYTDAVNGALWTMKVEWQLSLSAPIVVALCVRYSWNFKKCIIIILIMSIIYRLGFEYLYELSGKKIYEILGRQFFGQLLFFYGGILVYTYYDEFKSNFLKFIVLSSTIYALSSLIFDFPAYYLFIQPFVILLIVLSFSMIPNDIGAKIDGGHNISYEIFLCHFPIIQMAAHFRLIDKIGVAGALAVVITGTLLFALLTYHTVGKLYKKHYKSRSTPSDVK